MLKIKKKRRSKHSKTINIDKNKINLVVGLEKISNSRPKKGDVRARIKV